ncbi:unnamed protein product [Prorocentrum cordatum]|uniref:Uncharacterized protein n=1 Tax=Prorocentrum cordatum TaxID=2364126 RepID=A0ABN9W0N6_9DINO|nr:unnamed protein product [Polarella glacialis]
MLGAMAAAADPAGAAGPEATVLLGMTVPESCASPASERHGQQRRRSCGLALRLVGCSVAALAAGLAVRVANHADGASIGAASGLRSLRTSVSVVLYVTTHASDQHMSFLRCLPPLLRASPRLSEADVILYVGSDNLTDDRKRNITLLLEKWPLRNHIVHFGNNPGYQEGAMKAAHIGFSSGWFRGYDWVIRVNPVYVIYDDRAVWSRMEKAENWGVFVACRQVCEDHSGCTPNKTHTDFFAVRPSHVPQNAFADWRTAGNAERQATAAFKAIYEAKADVYIPSHRTEGCRVHGGGVWHSTHFCPEAEHSTAQTIRNLVTRRRRTGSRS